MLFFTFIFLSYDALQNMTGSQNTILYDEGGISGGTGGILRITSHGCDEAGGGWVKAHCKKSLAIFSSPAGLSLTKLSLEGNKLFPARIFCLVTSQLGRGKSLFFLYSTWNRWS